MTPYMGYVELAVGGSKVHAGSNGRLVWHHTPWLGARSPHSATSFMSGGAGRAHWMLASRARRMLATLWFRSHSRGAHQMFNKISQRG